MGESQRCAKASSHHNHLVENSHERCARQCILVEGAGSSIVGFEKNKEIGKRRTSFTNSYKDEVIGKSQFSRNNGTICLGE